VKIWQKTLILAALPITLNALGVVLMQDAIGRLSEALAAEQKAAESFRQLNNMYVSMVQFLGLYTGYLTSGDEGSRRLKLADQYFASSIASFRSIRERTPRNDDALDNGLNKLDQNIQGFDQMRKKGVQAATAPACSQNQLLMLYQLKPLIKQAGQLNLLYTYLLEASNKHRDQLAMEQKVSVEKIQRLILSLLVFNILITAAALFLFRRSLLSRLEVVLAHSKNLAGNQAVGPTLSGEDEFAQIDARLAEAKDELATAEAFRSQVVAMVAHDMRSPLSSAMTSLELLDAGVLGELPPEAQKKVGTISTGLDRLVILIDEFLDLDKLRRQKLELEISQFSLKALVADVVASLEGMAAQNAIKFQIIVPEMEVSADRNRLRQVLLNLLSNAIKFSYRDGTVTIDADAEASADSWSCSISDQGKGLSQSAKNELFQAYSASEASTLAIKGSGLGLFVCRWFTEAHGGVLEAVANKSGQGTTFMLTMPNSLWANLSPGSQEQHVFWNLLALASSTKTLGDRQAIVLEIFNKDIDNDLSVL